MLVASHVVKSGGETMSEAWKSWPGVPTSGSRLCPCSDIPDGGTLCLLQDEFPILLMRTGDAVKAYVNACPHQYLPLNHRGSKLLSADGGILRCTNHSAGFSADTGEGVEGLGIGRCLDAIPVTIDHNDQVLVCESEAELECVVD